MIGGLHMDIKKPVRLSLPKQIANEIEKNIKNGSLELGSKIPSEPELAKEFGVSRNTIREAVQSLIHAGVLEARQGDGTYILASGRFEANILKRLSDSGMNEVYEVRLCLEKDIVRLASLRRTESDILHIKEALIKRNEVKLTAKENTEVDLAFHIAIAKAAHNDIFFDLYKYVSKFISNSIQQKVESNNMEGDKVDQLHTELFNAINEKNVEKAENTIIRILDI
ncbi:FadR/GntR family transcriptional regulator [Vallitalea guaymasensis]|uniref:FadR/GntR family transcriptional regulator n=1 Tax=Vallitalea guaymasensis TaxID=1185412 RepID=UPI002352ED91|nr:FadR/GntR family transcriptional regulator [Vallitalea guaymasensis]